MNVRDAIKLSIDTGNMVSMMYLEDMSDKELMHRPCPGCNHINWQVGHLIASENHMGNTMNPGSMPALPAGFEAKYSKETATIDDASKFCTKAELLAVYKAQPTPRWRHGQNERRRFRPGHGRRLCTDGQARCSRFLAATG